MNAPTDAAAVREAAARVAITDAIASADAAFGYSFNLTRLVDGEETHTLTMPGFEPVNFDDRDEGYALIAERRNRARSDAILAAIRQLDLPGGEEVERLRAVIHNDAVMFGEIERRMRECWTGTGKLSDEGSASNDFRVWMNEAHNRQRDLKAVLGQNPFVPLKALTPARVERSGE